MTKRAFITGITGQDGHYLTSLLLSKGYKVYGMIRRSSVRTYDGFTESWAAKFPDAEPLELIYGDLTDASSLNKIIKQVQPDEVYNLGAQSHAGQSKDCPEYTAEITGMGTLRLLEAIRTNGSKCRFFQASSAELFGNVTESPQKENTPFNPRNPYGSAKVFAYWTTTNYRESGLVHASNGILYNHESPRRGESFVTRKITKAAARISLGLQNKLMLGNLDARRDWSYAGDTIEAIWQMIQQEEADDYVISSGQTHSVKEFVEAAFNHVNLDWEKYVEINPAFVRPVEPVQLVGDPVKIRNKLNWQPKVSFEQMIKMMIDHDLKLAHQEAKVLL